jgi:hypothetical protein
VKKDIVWEVLDPASPLVLFCDSSQSDKNVITSHGLWIIWKLFMSFNCVAFMAIMFVPLYQLCKCECGIYGGTKFLKVSMWPNPRTISQLIILYCITIDNCISNPVFGK